jgi:hypothetical protein
LTLLASIWGPSPSEDKKKLKYFPFLFFIVLLVELTSAYMAAHGKSNHFLNNLDSVFEFAFFLFFLNNCLKEFGSRKIATGLIYSFLLSIK